MPTTTRSRASQKGSSRVFDQAAELIGAGFELPEGAFLPDGWWGGMAGCIVSRR